jgi:NADH:ubiquinone oxidoreductase subunit D
MWFFGIINAVTLMIGGVELNPGPQMEEKLIDFMVEQREEMKGIHEWLVKNKSILDTNVKMDPMDKTMKILI